MLVKAIACISTLVASASADSIKLAQYVAIKNDFAEVLNGPEGAARVESLMAIARKDMPDYNIEAVTVRDITYHRRMQAASDPTDQVHQLANDNAPFCVLCGDCEGCVQAEGILEGYDPDPESYAHHYQEGSHVMAIEYRITCGAGGEYYINGPRADCDTVARRVNNLRSSPILAAAHAEQIIRAIQATAAADPSGLFNYDVVTSPGFEVAQSIQMPDEVMVTLPTDGGR
eukprot:SAG11_NODE_9_length_28972_cov_81.532539_5_plen_230_part_00